MRSGGGKSKGSAFEREICKALSLWISNGTCEDVFWRSAMSGGRSTVAAAKGKRLANQAGDISCIDPIGHAFMSRFMIECKFYKDLKLQGLITGGGHLIKFWDVAKAEAKRYDKTPLLIAKQNQVPVFVCLGLGGVDMLKLKKYCAVIVPGQNLYVVWFDNFLKYATRITNDLAPNN